MLWLEIHMAQLRVFLLGAPRIERDGVQIEVDTRKAIALLAYLAVGQRPHSRDALATLLWPEYDQTRARAVLRRTLSALNKALDGETLAADRETIGLRRAPEGAGGGQLWLDIDQFASRLAACQAHGHPPSDVCARCLPALAEAAAIYRDDFMAGFSLRDSPSFDEWQFFQAESLRRDLAGALERLIRGYSAQANFEPAIAYARRWLALDPLHEPAHRHLIELYAWAGQRAAALHQYRECVRILDQELGVAPLEETTRLYQAIKESQTTPPPPAIHHPASSNQVEIVGHGPRMMDDAPRANDHGQYQLVGRTAEWAILLDTYATIGENGRVVALEGEGGIGKTRLAEEFLADARARGASTSVVRCYEGESDLAYSPFIAGLRAARLPERRAAWWARLPAHWLIEVARLLPEMTALRPDLPPTPPLDGPGAQSRFFEGVSQLLLATFGELDSSSGDSPPGVLFFDDVQWADAASLDLLSYLVRRLRGQRVCLLLTWRSGQTAAVQRLRHLLAGAARDGAANIVQLARLSRAAVQELLRSIAATGVPLPNNIDEQLHRETEGLPFFLVEYLNTIPLDNAGKAGQDWALPSGARELLRARLAAVSETGWQLLTTAAAIGRSFDFDTLRAASGRGDEEIVIGLETLIDQGLVVERPASGVSHATLSPMYDFSHEKLRVLVYDETSLARRRLLHRRVAEALVGHGRGRRAIGTLAGQIAQHYRLAGQEALAAEFFKQAGEHARALYANTEALTHFRAALALGHPATAALHTAIGDLQTLTGEYGAALASYETAASLCGRAGLAEIERKLGQVHDRRGEWDLAESHVRAALAILDYEAESQIEAVASSPLSVETSQEPQIIDNERQTTERARLHADWSLIAHHRGQPERALALGHQALALAAVADTRTLAQVHNILGILGRSRGELDTASHHLALSLALAETLDDPAIRIAARNNLALARGASGDIDAALALAEDALALCASQGDRHREAALHNNLADLLYAKGQNDAAMRHLKQAVKIFAEIGLDAGAMQPEIWKLVEW
jgi:DNA-binding SARP family transcriptional activator